MRLLHSCTLLIGLTTMVFAAPPAGTPAPSAKPPKPTPVSSKPATAPEPPASVSAAVPRMTFDFKDTDIRDIARSISIAYGLNILIDKDITVKVTVHLTDVPVMEGLRTILESNGLALVREGDLYRITKPVDRGSAAIDAKRDTISFNISNVEVNDFIRDISSKTGINIIAEKNVTGRVSGSLRNVDVEDGIRALLEANGFTMQYRGEILVVGMPSEDAKRRPDREARRLDVRVKDKKVTLDLKGADLGDVLKEIADQGKLDMITYGAVRGEVNAKLKEMPIEHAVALLVSGTQYTFAIREDILLIGDRNVTTPSGQALSIAELVHVKHIKAEGLPNLLPKTIPTGNVQVIKEQNAVLVTGTTDIIAQVNEFIRQIDIPTPQIMIEAVIVEYGRDQGREVGVSARSGRGADSLEMLLPSIAYGVGARTLNPRLPSDIAGFKFGTVGFLPDDFVIRLHALERDKRAKILAQPRIATLNGNKASIHVGTTSYFRLAGGTTTFPIPRFQTIQSGITFNITPWISKSGQVTAEISPEVSNTTGINEEGFPDISVRNVSTTVRLNDGETIILGGLIRSEDKSTIEKVPILGDIPLLGWLFRSKIAAKSSSELAIYITPHILNKEDIVDIDKELEQFKTRSNSGKVPELR